MNALGRHILVEYYGCDANKLNDVPYIEESMVDAARAADATVINSSFHHFSPYGVSGVVVIQESHLAIHTWPEYGYAAVDIFTCGSTVDPWIAYRFLEEKLGASSGSSLEMLRGQWQLIPQTRQELDEAREQTHAQAGQTVPKFSRDVWFTERNEMTAVSFKHEGRPLFKEQSPYQLVEIYDTLAYGKTLTLDRMVMTTEKDEFVYHEMITHVPMISHGRVRKALVIGGGDGGTVREILRHKELEEVVMVEIDEAVIRASKEHLPGIAVALDSGDPRLEVIVGDGIEYVERAEDESFDLIIVDSTDPVGPAEGLFSESFYRQVHRVLKPGGVMVAQSESPHYAPEVFKEIYTCYGEVFGSANVHPYLAHIPTYPTGMWSFAYCSKAGAHPINDLNREYSQQFASQESTKYYSASIHQACFAIPPFVQNMIQHPELEPDSQ
jgi:spermidine synthase